MGQGGSGGIPPEDLSVMRLASDTILFKSKKDKNLSYILSQKDSPFVNFCLLAESIVKTRDSLVRAYAPRQDASFSDDNDVGLFDSSGADTEPPSPPNPVETRLPDEESGGGMQMSGGGMQMTENDHATVFNGQRVESFGNELDPNMRRRAQSPPRNGDEQWVVSVDKGSRAKRRDPPTSSIPGTIAHSTLVRMMPSALEGEGMDEQEFCCINSIELWNAYSVYISIRSVDMGLIRAIDRGEVDISTASPTNSPAEAVRERVNAWRSGYADNVMSYNAAMDLFVERAADHLGKEASRGNDDAQALLGLVYAMAKYRASMIPVVAGDERDSR